MDDLIDIFFDHNYTEEQRSLLYKALGVCTVFGLTTVSSDVTDYIMREGEEHKEVIVSQVYETIEAAIDRLIDSHRILLEPNPDLGFKVSLLEGIYGLSYREYYQPFAIALEDYSKTNEEKFAWIISEVTGLEEDTIMEYLSWVYDGTMNRLKELIESKALEEEGPIDLEVVKAIRKNLLIFETAFGLPLAIKGLLEIDPPKGARFEHYFELFKEGLIDNTDIESSVWRLLWLAFISEDGYNNPQKLLLEKSEIFFSDLSLRNIFTSMLQKAMGRFQDFKGNMK